MSGADDLVGTMLDDRYQIIGLLGQGGMGQVYEGLHIALDRTVAIKVLHPRLAHDERFRERFLREARSASRIRHPNVVQILDFGHTPTGSVYFVMEFLDGQDLRSLIHKEGPLPWPRARNILWQATSALMAAHGRGIIHRDIKPANCVLCDLADQKLTDVVKLLDFGIAKVTTANEDDGDSLTGTGEVFGTATYMAPEQAHGQMLDARSDIYSFGIMAYEMLTGRVPFTGANPIHIITRHISEPPQPPRQLVSSIPPAAEALVLRAIAKRPADRFSSMAELEAALLAIPEHGEAGVSAAPPVYSGPVSVSQPPAAAAVQTAVVSPSAPSPQASEPPRSPKTEVFTTPSGPGFQAAEPPPAAGSSNSTRPPPDGVDLPTTPHPAVSQSATDTGRLGAATIQSVDTSSGTLMMPRRTGRALPLALGSVALAAVLGGGAWLATSRDQPPEGAEPAVIAEVAAKGAGGLGPSAGEPDPAEAHEVDPGAPAHDEVTAEPTADGEATEDGPAPIEEPETAPTEAASKEPAQAPPAEAEPRQASQPSPKPKVSKPAKMTPSAAALPNKKKSDFSVKAQIVKNIKKKCGADHGGTRVGVELTVGSNGAILMKIVSAPGSLKTCVNGVLGKARFPEGSVRKLEFSVDL